MISATLLACLATLPLTGQPVCRNVQRVVVQKQFVQHHAAVVAPVVSYSSYPAIVPVYAMGQQQQVDKLQTLLESVEEGNRQRDQLIAQQAAMLQAIGGQLPGPEVSETQVRAQAIFTKSCVACHSGPQPKGGLDFTDIGQLTTKQRLLAEFKIESAEMPPEPKPALSDEDFQAVREWVRGDSEAFEAFLKGEGE